MMLLRDLRKIRNQISRRIERPAAALLLGVLVTVVDCNAALGNEASEAAETSWAQFRGPTGQGLSDTQGLPTRWSESEAVQWKVLLPGRGWSSPVVVGDRAWLTTALETKATAEQQQARTAGEKMAAQLDVASQVRLLALEVDLTTGKLLREIDLFAVNDPDPIHSLNSFASPTPVLSDGFCYCHFGTLGTACIETSTGEVRWRKQLPLQHNVGPGSSPIIAGDLLILTCDGADDQYVTALRLNDGEPAWRTDRPPIRAEDGDFRKAFSTPLLIDVEGLQQVVIPGAQWFCSYDPATGKELWRVDHGKGFSNVPAPVYDGEHLFLATGFATSELWAVDPRGSGDIGKTHVRWKNKRQIPKMPSPVLTAGGLMVVSDDGVASCFATSDGQQLWKKRLGGNYSASPIVADGKVYFLSRDGNCTVIAASKEYQPLEKNELSGDFLASPAIYERSLLLRSGSHLYRVGD